MTAYRFCRTDDIGLLVDALNRCWAPHFPDEPLATPASFKRTIRDLQVWCSSCMVAFAGSEPVGVLIGAKRPSGTLVHRIAVHPDHLRQGHARHLLDSLGSKLAILGPPRIVAEVPETLAPAGALFSASGYTEEAVLTDYILERDKIAVGEADRASEDHSGRFIIPVTIDDLAANDLLGAAYPQTCWERAVETLSARKEEIDGFAVASDERIEAYLLSASCNTEPEADAADGPRAHARTVDILLFRSMVEDDGAALKQLLLRLCARGVDCFRFPRVHPAEISKELLETLGFRAAGTHRLYAGSARAH